MVGVLVALHSWHRWSNVLSLQSPVMRGGSSIPFLASSGGSGVTGKHLICRVFKMCSFCHKTNIYWLNSHRSCSITLDENFIWGARLLTAAHAVPLESPLPVMYGDRLKPVVLLALGVSSCPSQMYEVTHVFIVVHIKTFSKSLGVKPKSLYIFLQTPTKFGLDPQINEC